MAKKGTKKVATRKTHDDAQVDTAVEAAEAAGAEKPEIFVKLLKGNRFTDRDTGDIYIKDIMTPVKEVSAWVKIQMEADKNMFRIFK